MTTTITIEGAVKHGWDLWKTHKMTLIISTIIIGVLESLGSDHSRHHWHTPSLFVSLISLAAFIIFFIVQIGWLKTLLMIEDGGNPSWKEIFMHKRLFWKFLAACILLGIGTAFLTIFFVIPGVYFFITYSFVPLLIVDKNADIGDAFKQSALMTQNMKLIIFGLFVAIVIMNIIGAIALVVGLVVSIPVGMLAFVYVYRTLSKSTAAGEPVAVAISSESGTIAS